MQIKKTYKEINPELLYAEIKSLALKHGVILSDENLTTYSQPSDSSYFISRGTLSFKTDDKSGPGKEVLNAHILGSVRGDTRLLLDIDEKLFPEQEIAAFQEELEFIFG